MPAYNFMAQFVEPIQSGRKNHTIRAKRRRPTLPGEKIVLYTGQRTCHCRKILDAVCSKVQDIEITAEGTIIIDGVRLSSDEREALAKADGFDCYVDMIRFWDGRLPFFGDIIHWRRKK